MHEAVDACDELTGVCSQLRWGDDYEKSRLDLHARVARLCSSDRKDPAVAQSGTREGALERKLSHLAKVELRKLSKLENDDESEVTSMTVGELEKASRRVEHGHVHSRKDLRAAQAVLDASNLADVDPELQEGGTNVTSTAENVVNVEDIRVMTDEAEGRELPLQECPPEALPGSDHIILQGDMRVPRKYASLIEQRWQISHGMRAGATGRGKVAAGEPWPDAIVPFCFARDIRKASKIAFLEGVEHYRNQGACVTFREIEPAANEAKCVSKPSVYVQSREPGKCWSDVGYFNMGNEMNLGRGCEVKGIVVHEIGHTLGMEHEQARPDRDRHVKVVWANVKPGLEDEFAINPDAYTKEPYDYLSVMHYGSFTFSKDKSRTRFISKKLRTLLRRGKPTITSVAGQVIPGLGQAMGLSDMDVRQLADMYCPDKKNTTIDPNSDIGDDHARAAMQSHGGHQVNQLSGLVLLFLPWFLLKHHAEATA